MLLSLSTSGHGASLAVASPDGGQIHAEATLSDSHQQAEKLIPLIEATLANAGCSYPSLTAIFADIGPGSFTGIRIGLATARGLGLALSVPVHGLSPIQALAFASRQPGPFWVAEEALRGQCYGQPFHHHLAPAGDVVAMHYQEMADLLTQQQLPAIGSGVASLCRHGYPREAHGGDEAPMARLFCQLYAVAGQACLQPPLPLYIREPDAKLPSPFLATSA